jgi:hypothetical protein
MYDMNDYDERFQRHAQKTAAVDQDGWKKPQPRRRAVRAAMAKALFALAARIAPPNVADASARPTLTDMRGI